MGKGPQNVQGATGEEIQKFCLLCM